MIYYLIGGTGKKNQKTNAFVVALSVLGSTSATINSERATASHYLLTDLLLHPFARDTNKTILLKITTLPKISISYLIY
jgi:hypothetical protein